MNSKFFLYLSIFLIFVILLQGGCHYFENRQHQNTVNDLQKQVAAGKKEIYRIDTFYNQIPPITVQGQPIRIVDTVKQKTEITKYLDRLVYVDSSRGARDSLEQILREHFAFRVYTDSFPVYGAKGAVVDTIFRNDLIGRRFYIPAHTDISVRETVEKKRAILYLVGTLQGNKTDIIDAFGGGAMLKFKNDKAIEIQGLYDERYNGRQGGFFDRLNYQLSYKQPIKLRKWYLKLF